MQVLFCTVSEATEMGKEKMTHSSAEEDINMPTKITSKAGRPLTVEFGEYEIDTSFASPYPDELSNVPKLFICEFCLKYWDDPSDFNTHIVDCNWRQPCGKEIYKKDELSIFEVDGEIERTYCENLCLHVKLFIDDKRMDWDVEDFLFYVLTVSYEQEKHVAGYFSKEKCPDVNNNLSCLLILPQCQRQGYGRFLIDFSYLLSRVEKVAGTPEKPLSKLGLLTYQSYWQSSIGKHLYDHIDEKSISVKSISEQTGIDPYDIADTLQMLNLVKQRNGKLSIVIKQRTLAEQMEILKSKNHILLDPDCLSWTPLDQSTSPKKKRLNELDNKNETGKRKMLPSVSSDAVSPPPSKLHKKENAESVFTVADDTSLPKQ